jgi:hypothetical protein
VTFVSLERNKEITNSKDHITNGHQCSNSNMINEKVWNYAEKFSSPLGGEG